MKAAASAECWPAFSAGTGRFTIDIPDRDGITYRLHLTAKKAERRSAISLVLGYIELALMELLAIRTTNSPL